MFRFDVKSVDVIELAIIGFARNRQAPILGRLILSGDQPLNGGITCNAAAMRVGQCNGRCQFAGFLDPVQTGQFAIAIKGIASRRACRLRIISTPRQDRRDTGTDRTLANHARAVSPYQRRVTDFYTTNISNGIKCPWRAWKMNSESTKAFFTGRCLVPIG